jgi:amino acid adenylation domain-containing protein
VQNNPDNTALVFGDTRLSYSELDRRVNQMANYLIAEGVQREDRIGVCLPRNELVLISFLAIWRAGAAYVPLDPSYPQERLAYIAENADVSRVLVSIGTDMEVFSEHVTRLVTDSEKMITEVAAQPDNTPVIAYTGGHSLAYILYTSGSTGNPKGVCIEHHSLVNILRYMKDEKPGIKASDRMLCLTSIGFDIIGVELYLPILCGAQVHMGDDALVKDGARIRDYINQHNITCVQATPSSWQILLMEDDWSPGPDFKALCGGEALPEHTAADLLARLARHGGRAWNFYGPTETTIWSSGLELGEGEVRVGPGLYNTQFYVLSPEGQLQPPGCQGELFISGEGLARAYWSKPELTEERFISLPHVADGARIYSTGDKVRWLANGTLEYLGRMDTQVKLRGFRIELGEIESRLVDLEEVEQGAVVLQEHNSNKHLVAFITLEGDSYEQGDHEVLQASIKGRLQAHLPDYMIPTFVRVVNCLPKTPNDKLDRKALQKMGTNEISQVEYKEPVSEMEKKLSSIWQSILSKERISIDANIFEEGVDSILLMKTISQLRKQNILLSLKDAFKYQTIESLAKYLEDNEKSREQVLITDEKLLKDKGIII